MSAVDSKTQKLRGTQQFLGTASTAFHVISPCAVEQSQKQFQTQAALGGSPLEDGQIIHIYVYVFIYINLRRHFLPEVIQRNYFEILKYLKLITLRHSCEPNLATGYGAAVPNSGSM